MIQPGISASSFGKGQGNGRPLVEVRDQQNNTHDWYTDHYWDNNRFHVNGTS